MGPWMVRNAVVVGRLALTHGYASHALVQRISFDQMTWREYGLSYLCWLPRGASIAEEFVGDHACDRFGWDELPNTFYSAGGPLLRDTLQAAGGWDRHLGYLVTNYILRQPVKHALVTIPLALRGAWIDHFWGLFLMPICLFSTVRAMRKGNAAFLFVVLPAWFMLLFNAAVAVNQTRYNLILIPAFALSGTGLVEWLLRWRARRRAAVADQERQDRPPAAPVTENALDRGGNPGR